MSDQKNPIPFQRPGVPIIGQPFTIRAWFPTVLANCSCDSKHAMLLQGVGNVTTCPDCGKSLMIQELVQDPASQQIGVKVALVVPRPAAAQPS